MRTKSSLLAFVATVLTVAAVVAATEVARGQGQYCEGSTATTGAATEVSNTSAKLNGRVNPGGPAATYHFEYGPTTSYGSRTPEGSVSGSAPQDVSALADGLTPNTTYHFRLVVTKQGSTCAGGDQTFQTTDQPAGAPVVATGDARNITGTSATLTGALIPGAQPVQYAFAYGTSTSYDKATALRSAAAGQQGVAVSEAVSGLQPGTLYHFQLFATNEAGQGGAGGDRTFSTVAVQTGKVRPRSVSSKVRPKRDRKAPYRYKITGKVQLPAGVSRARAGAAQRSTCSGRVRIRIKQGKRTRGKGSAKVRPSCRYAKRVRAKPRPKARVRGKLKVRIRYLGNRQLKQRQARTRTVFYGPRR